jgi:signal transduction histidine kinase
MPKDNAPLDELKWSALPEAGAALRAAKHDILQRWRAGVSQILPKSDELTRRQLEDSLPDLIDQIAAALASDRPAPTEQLLAASPSHGRIRHHQAFSLNELLIEYHVLRRIVIQEMSRALGRPLSVEEDVAVNQGIDVALRQAAVAFADDQAGSLQTEVAAMAKFLSFLSHDLRGGLNGAVLMIEVLRRELAHEPKFASAAEDLDVVRRSMLDTVATMERFLSAEKLRLGRMPVKAAPFDVAELLGELQRGFSIHLKEAAVDMEVVSPSPGTKITSDRQLVTMVVQNLISNAIKYGRKGKVRVTTKGPGDVAPDVRFRFAVSDHGPGIAPEKLAELFAPFSRGETYGQKGIGLGLFIARQASDLLAAKLWAESKPGKGATFYLDLANA